MERTSARMQPVVRRWIAIIALSLCMGAVANVSVAWACGLSAEFRRGHSSFPLTERAHTVWRRNVPASWPAKSARTSVSEDIGVQSISMWDPADLSSPTTHRMSWFQSGWPEYGVQGYTMWASSPTSSYNRTVGVLRFFDAPMNFIPLWPGFATNTLLYGIFAFAATMAFLRLGEHQQWRSGKCSTCAHPIGASAVCTECGSPIKRKPRESAARR